MEIKVGNTLEEIILPSIDGSEFNIASVKGKKVLLTFYRFAKCPICNLRINEFVKRYDEFGENFTMVGIFDSELKNLQKAMEKHKVPFTILADEQYKYFSIYNVRRSVWGIIRAMIFRFPRVMKAMMQYFPLPIRGHFSIHPVDILVDEEGVVQQVKYGKDIADHFSFNEVKSFSIKKAQSFV